MPDPIRLVLADDHYLVREGTRSLLELSGHHRHIPLQAGVQILWCE